MGSVGIDIKDALEEIGTKITYTSGETSVEEYIKIELNAQATKPFIREYFLEVMLPYNSGVSVGDIIRTTYADNLYYMVMNKTPDAFENELIRYTGVLYKCNILGGSVLRSSGETWDEQTYQKTPVWETITNSFYGLITEPLFGNQLDESQEFGQIDIKKHELYAPTSIGIQVKDRIEPVSGEYYVVTTVLHNRYNGVDVIELEEDTR